LASLCLGLSFLTQSRGIVIGLCLGGCVALLAGPDRVRRAWVAILTVAGVALASPWLLRPYHAFTGDRFGTVPHEITVAATALMILTGIAFLVGMLLAVFDQGLRADSPQMRSLRTAARAALVMVAVVAVVGAIAAMGNPVTFAHHKWDQFRSLNANTTTSSTRLLTVGGQRYDLWRVALKEFAGSPILGVGADNYSFGYYRDRETNRNLSDPHSLLFSLLSELGIVGTGLCFAFILGLLVAIRRAWKALGPGHRRAVVASSAAGAVLLGQSMVDWIWLIPGLTAIGLFLLAAAAAQASGVGAADRRARATATTASDSRPRAAIRIPWLRAAAIGALLAATLGVLALFLSDAYVQRARTSIYTPTAELSAAQTAATLDPWAVVPHYLEASAYETMGERSLAYGQLRDALSLEPANQATLGVLGDFEVRSGNLAAARAYYRRALALNPLDVGLQQLARIGEPRAGSRARGAQQHH
jgi:O-antigen ligase